MSRIRTIKPEFWTDPDVVSCSMAARLFFIGCWNQADDHGVLKDEPTRLKLEILPADDVDPVALVNELVHHRLLLRKVAPDGTPVLVVRTFAIHQRIDKRVVGRYGDPSEFTDPQVSEGGEAIATDRDGSRQIATDPARSRAIPRDPALGKEGKGKEGKGQPISSAEPTERPTGLAVVPDPPPKPPTRTRATGDPAFDEFYAAYPRHVGRPAALKAWAKAITRAGPAEIIAGALRYANDPNREDQFTAHPATWLNRDGWGDDPLPDRRRGTVPERNRAAITEHLTTQRPGFRERMELARQVGEQQAALAAPHRLPLTAGAT